MAIYTHDMYREDVEGVLEKLEGLFRAIPDEAASYRVLRDSHTYLARLKDIRTQMGHYIGTLNNLNEMAERFGLETEVYTKRIILEKDYLATFESGIKNVELILIGEQA